MVFSSPIFLFLFLPLTLAVHFLLPRRARNMWLLAASLVFYGGGEPKFLVECLLGSHPDFAYLAIVFALALVGAGVSYAVFKRVERTFADVI